MDRKEFLKIFGLGAVGAAVASSGLSEDFILDNLRKDKEIVYVELPHLPGTRFVFATSEEASKMTQMQGSVYIGHIEVDLLQAKNFFNKSLFYKTPQGEFVSYDQALLPYLNNEKLKQLKLLS